jgi:hypothetical protein
LSPRTSLHLCRRHRCSLPSSLQIPPHPDFEAPDNGCLPTLHDPDGLIAIEKELNPSFFQGLLQVAQGARLWDSVSILETGNGGPRHARCRSQFVLTHSKPCAGSSELIAVNHSVKTRFPDLVRLTYIGHANQNTTFRLVPVTQGLEGTTPLVQWEPEGPVN